MTQEQQINHQPKCQSRGPVVQQPAPYFEGTAVVNGNFKTINLDQYKGQWVLLGAYPMDFTFVCPTEIIAYSEAAQEFAKRNCQVILWSTDSEFSHLAFINTDRKNGGLGPMNIPLLADPSHKISKDYGVLIEDAGVALRGSFLIDPKGVLRQITINDLPVGRSVQESLRLLEAFQFTDQYGEVCPANWTPEKPTIKPTVQQSKEYFSQVN